MKPSRAALLILALLTLVADQATKHWASTLPHASTSATLVHVRYEKTHVAWGQLVPGPFSEKLNTFLVMGASVLALAFLGFMLLRSVEERQDLRIALALVFGGALGNFLDRAFRGAAIELLEIRWSSSLHSLTFNVADAATAAGVALVLVSLFRSQTVRLPASRAAA